jgi:hypothetical protein
MPRPAGLPKTGGRRAGTPNKSTTQLKAFLERVFTRAFTEKTKIVRDGVELEVGLEDVLVAQIINLTIDVKLFQTLLAHYAGAPAKQLDVNHKGTVSLAQLVAGVIPNDELEDDDPPATTEDPQ